MGHYIGHRDDAAVHLQRALDDERRARVRVAAAEYQLASADLAEAAVAGNRIGSPDPLTALRYVEDCVYGSVEEHDRAMRLSVPRTTATSGPTGDAVCAIEAGVVKDQ